MRSVLSIRRHCRLPPVHRSPEAIFDVNKRRDLNCNLLHRRREERSSDYRQLFFKNGSARFFSTLPLTTVWSNLQTVFNDFLEVYFTKMVTLSPNVPSDFTVQFNSVDLMTSSIILHSDWSVVLQLTKLLLMWPSFRYVNIIHQSFIFSKSIMVNLLLLICVSLTITGQPRNSVFIRRV